MQGRRPEKIQGRRLDLDNANKKMGNPGSLKLAMRDPICRAEKLMLTL